MPGSALQYRIVVWVLRLGLPLLLVLGGIVYAAHRGAMRLLEPLHWYGDVTVEEVSFDLGGKVHAKTIGYRPFGAPEGAGLTVRGVDIATPGLVWLVSAGLAGDDQSPAEKRRAAALKGSRGGLHPEPRALPAISTLSASADAVEIANASWLPAGLRWLGPATGSPFESLGCGSGRRFDAEVLEALGVPSGPLKGEFRLDASGDRAKVEVRVFGEGRSSTAWSGDVRLKEPARFFDTDWQDMALAAEQWLVTDESFVVARNRYCARLARVTRNGYVDLHAGAIEHELAKMGLGIPPELLDVFKRFDTRGGELSWHSRPQSPLNRAAFEAMPLEEQLRKLESELSVSGEPPHPFTLTRLSAEDAAAIAAMPVVTPSAGATPPTPAAAPSAGASVAAGAAQPPQTAPPPVAPPPPAPSAGAASANAKPPAPGPAAPPAASAAGAGTASAAPVTPPQAATPVPAATAAAPPQAPAAKPPETVAKVKQKPLPSYGRVRFDDLERAVGRTVAVETRFGTRRVGKVVGFNRAAVTIDINEKGTSLPLTVPRGTVLTIELLSPESG